MPRPRPRWTADRGEIVVSSPLPDGRILATFNVSLLAEASGNLSGGEPMTPLPVPQGLDVDVSVPTALLAALAAEEDPVNFRVAQVKETAGYEVSPAPGSGGPTLEVLAMLELEFRHFVSQEKVNISDLEMPIEFRLPATFAEGVKCAWWDGDAWSVEGVEVSSKSTAGGDVVCETRHLTLFGAILQGFIETVLCANFGLFNLEAFRQIFKGSWVMGLGACMCWCLLLLVLAMFLAAARLDRFRERKMHWRDDYFLLEGRDDAPAAPTADDAAPDDVEAGGRRRALPGRACALACCPALYDSMKGSSALREAVDDILSQWLSFFSELRSCLEGLWEGCEHGLGDGAGQLRHMGEHATTLFVLVTARQLACRTMGLSESVVMFVMKDEDLHDFLMQDYNEPARAGSGLQQPQANEGASNSRRGEWRSSGSQRQAWRMLHDEVSHHLVMQTNGLMEQGVVRAVAGLFLFGNPVGAVFVMDIFQSCKQRVLVLAVDLFGAFALSCLFFEAAGLVRGKQVGGGGGEDLCGGGGEEEASSLGRKLGRFIAIALGSVLVAGIPAMLLESLQTKGFKKLDRRDSPAWRRQLRVWQVQQRLFWGLGGAILAFQFLYTFLFLANIGPEDDQDWSTAGLIAVAQDFLFIPFCAAFSRPTLAFVSVFVQSKLTGTDVATVIRRASHQLHDRTNVMLPLVNM